MKKAIVAVLGFVMAGLMGLMMTRPAMAEEAAAGSVSFWEKTKVTGGIDVNYNYNFNRPTTGSAARSGGAVNPSGAGTMATNGYRGFDANANTFNLSLVELNIANSPKDWMTFMTSLDFGHDATIFHAAGFGALTDIFDLKQAYVTLKAPVGSGLTFKIGKFVTMHGAEVIGDWTNNNVSGSFLFNYAIPFTHTGVLANYAFADWISLDLGVVNGWNNVVDTNNGKSIHGMLTIKPFDKLTWYLGGTFGPEGASSDSKITALIDTTLTYVPNERWSFTANYDWGHNNPVPGAVVIHAAGAAADWQGLALYAHWRPMDMFGLTVRGEIMQDNVGMLGGGLATGSTASTRVYEGTLTSHFYLAEGLDLRFEFRHDYGNKTSFLQGTGKSRKFQDTIASQLVYSF